MKRVGLILALLLMSACSTNYSADIYFDETAEKNTLQKLLPYIAKPAPGANYTNRLNEEFKAYYSGELYKFDLISYKKLEDSSAYFLIYKLAPSMNKKFIAIGGKMLMQDGKIVAFEEFFNTPKMMREDLDEKASILFEELVKSGNVSRYVGNYEWIEFPDSRVVYDKKNMRWRFVWEEAGLENRF